MKGSSLATVALVAIIATIATAFIVNSFLGDPSDETVDVKYMDIIVPGVENPDPEVFGIRAVNPTVEVYVGNCKEHEFWDDDRQICVEDERGIDDPDSPDEELEE